MRFKNSAGNTVHLSYCSNVHPAEDVEGIQEQLREITRGVRERLGVSRLGIGLWLPAEAAHRLANNQNDRQALKATLDECGLEVVTLNAFPYGGFHDPVVKHKVYYPDWTEDARLDFTLDAARVLADLLPDDAARGSISTLPLAWRDPWDAERASKAISNLNRLADGLAALHEETGRTIRVGFEPEPGCIIESVSEAIEHLAEMNKQWLGICVDTCHMATSFEDPNTVVQRLQAADLPIVKSQISSALHVDAPHADKSRAALQDFVEDRFLHQVRKEVRLPDGSSQLLGDDDLPESLVSKDMEGDGAWRVHFHLPLHATPEAPMNNTVAETRQTLEHMVGGTQTLVDHLEVETYTWSVLPQERRPKNNSELMDGIAAELQVASDMLTDLGMKRE